MECLSHTGCAAIAAHSFEVSALPLWANSSSLELPPTVVPTPSVAHGNTRFQCSVRIDTPDYIGELSPSHHHLSIPIAGKKHSANSIISLLQTETYAMISMLFCLGLYLCYTTSLAQMTYAISPLVKKPLTNKSIWKGTYDMQRCAIMVCQTYIATPNQCLCTNH